MEVSRMRAAWGTLVTVGAFVVIFGIAGGMASEYIDKYGTLLGSTGAEVNLATATLDRMRDLIGRLQAR
jgi:hypothetical protein